MENKYERARIIGARAFELALNAKTNLKKKEINSEDPVLIAMKEYEKKEVPLKVYKKSKEE